MYKLYMWLYGEEDYPYVITGDDFEDLLEKQEEFMDICLASYIEETGVIV